MPRRRKPVAQREYSTWDLAAIELAEDLEEDGEHQDVAELIRAELPRGRFRPADVIRLQRLVRHRDRGHANADYEAWALAMLVERRRPAVPWRDGGAL